VNQSDVDWELATGMNGERYGDANLDRKVEYGDFQALLDNWQRSGCTWAQGNFKRDGVAGTLVEYGDFQALLDNWSPLGFGAAAPEPATLGLLILGGLGLLRRRRVER
jgi:hypothetical protein